MPNNEIADPAPFSRRRDGFEPDIAIRCRNFRIGCIGSGFIMADCHLAAYRKAQFPVVAIASRSPDNAARVAQRWGIATVHPTPAALLDDPDVQIVDIAVPTDVQPTLIREALTRPHIKAVLAQKPLANSFAEAKSIVEDCRAAGKVLAVNQQMRFDQSVRVLKQLLDGGALGAPVLATIEMRQPLYWREDVKKIGRLALLTMSIHHLDALRFLFGDPTSIFTAARRDPRQTIPHEDGLTVSTLRFPSGVLAVSLEDIWAGVARQTDFDADTYIKWRVEGTEGYAQGTFGWPDHPAGSPSTLRYVSLRETDGRAVSPTWDTRWFPDAFQGPMEGLQYALATGAEPMPSGDDNLRTMALVEAGYRSIAQNRPVALGEFGF